MSRFSDSFFKLLLCVRPLCQKSFAIAAESAAGRFETGRFRILRKKGAKRRMGEKKVPSILSLLLLVFQKWPPEFLKKERFL